MSRVRPRAAIGPLGFVAAVISCAEGGPPGEAPSVGRDSAGIRIVENRPHEVADTCRVSAAPVLDIGLVEGPSEYQFYRMFDAATLSDGRIAVVNQGSSEIRVYSPDGAFLYAFGREGGGPGEFRDVFQLWVTEGDTLVVGDYRPWRFSFFEADGEYIRAVVPEPIYPNVPSFIGLMDSGEYILSQECCFLGMDAEGWVESELSVVRHGRDGRLIDTVAVYPNGRRGWLDREIRFTGRPVFEATTRVAAGRDWIIVGRAIERELEVLDPRGRLTGLIRWTGPERSVTPADVEAYRAAERERWAGPPGMEAALSALVSDDRPVADRFPAHAGIRLGREGDIWVQEYPRPGAAEASPWLVFDESGRFRCHAVLPESFRVYEIGPDYLLGEGADEFQVEHVRRYGLRRP